MAQDKRDLITVIIPNYNGIQYIENCIDSILQGSFIPRIIVVDNASTDGSRELIAEKYPQVLLMPLSANTGFCHAVNTGLHITRSKYVMLLNNDTRLDPRCIEELYTRIVQNGRVFSAQAKMLSMKDPGVIDDAGDLYNAMGWAFARGKAKSADRYSRDDEIFSSCAGAAMYRMKVFEKIGYFDERHFCYLEDVDICFRAKIYGYRNLYASRAIVYHAGSASSGSVHNPFKEEMTAGNSYYMLYKNMPALMYAVNSPMWKMGIAVKKKYFYKKGLGKAYDQGLLRGQILKARAQDMDEAKKYDYPYKKDSVPEESCLSSFDEKQADVMPLYLGGKVPFQLSHLGNYIRIEGELIASTWKRLLG